MINEKLRKYLNDDGFDCIILDNPSFDNSIVGFSTDGRLVYDFDKMVQEYVEDTKEEYVDGIEYLSYNTLRALPYMGDKAPIIVNKFEGVE